MSTIKIKKLTFAYDGASPLFDNTNLNLDTSWHLALVGRNGRGKTTLLNILQNKLEYNGTIESLQEFMYFPKKVKDPTQLAFYAVTEGEKDIEQWKIEREMNLLGISPDLLWQAFNTLSGGEQTKLLLSILFAADNSFALIDEPTNHLDTYGRKKVANYLQKKKQGFIVVSHDRSFLDEVSDHILSIEKAKIVLTQGDFSTYYGEKERSDESEKVQNEKLKSEISRLKETSRKKAEWSMGREGDKYGSSKIKGSGSIGDTGFIGARAARVMKKAKNLERRMDGEIQEKEKLLKNIEEIVPLKMTPSENYHKRYIVCEEFSCGFEGKPLFQPLTFQIEKGDRMALCGKNGVGKTQCINALLGEFSGEIKGKLTSANGLKLSYVRQNFEENKGTLKEFATSNHIDYEAFLNNLKKLGLERSAFSQKIETMSMGQKKKVEVAKSLSEVCDLYIWDEALNYLDFYNHEQIREVLLTCGATILFIEHDETFVQEVATKVLRLKKA